MKRKEQCGNNMSKFQNYDYLIGRMYFECIYGCNETEAAMVAEFASGERSSEQFNAGTKYVCTLATALSSTLLLRTGSVRFTPTVPHLWAKNNRLARYCALGCVKKQPSSSACSWVSWWASHGIRLEIFNQACSKSMLEQLVWFNKWKFTKKEQWANLKELWVNWNITFE